MTTPTGSTLTRLRDFFGMTTQEFTKQWRLLSEKDKQQLREGFENGSMTY